MNAMRAKVSETGRLSLPAEIRKAVGLEHGGTVMVDVETDGAIRIRTVEQVVARAQEMARQMLEGKSAMTVDEFVAERHREAVREEEEFRRCDRGAGRREDDA